jgi:hypothetical protein
MHDLDSEVLSVGCSVPLLFYILVIFVIVEPRRGRRYTRHKRQRAPKGSSTLAVEEIALSDCI